MLRRSLDILEFIKHPELLNDPTLSVAQQVFLKVTYGLPLTDEESEIYQRATGQSRVVNSEQNEVTLIAGRRSGKTSKIAATIAVYEAFRDHNLNFGDRGSVILIAPTKSQAGIALRYIYKALDTSPLLRRYIVRKRRDEIELANNVNIVCCPCSHVGVRGLSIVCAICDELAFWSHRETAANPEEEVLAALRPAMATFPTAKLVKISTPYRQEGTLWREFKERSQLDHLVWHFPSNEMNPTIQQSILDKERKRDEQKFRREFLADFTDDITRWISPEVLDLCIVEGRTELPRVENTKYVVAIDPAFQRNDFALAVVHQTGDGPIVVDHIRHWSGTKKAPLGYEFVCGEVARIASQYGTRTVVGDQYCAAIIKQFFDRLGIRYTIHTFGSHTRADLFGNLRQLLIQRRIELLDLPILLSQLRALEERKRPNGDFDIRPYSCQKDDVAVATALAAFELATRPRPRRLWVEVMPLRLSNEGALARGRFSERGWIRIC